VRLRPPSASRTGEELRSARIRCGYDVVSVARELGVPPGDLRALEWDRADLLGDRYAAKLLRSYVEWLEPEGVPRPSKGSIEPRPAPE
jgi:cytoskeletal protein RodZ